MGTYEEIETQNCVPKAEKECETKEVEQETVTYEKECKEVTSKDCAPGHVVKHGIIKREAEADAWGAGIYGHTIKSDCREVTKKVCVNTPKKTTKKVPVTNCNTKQTVSCHKVTKKIPKKNCETVEATVSVPVAEPVAHATVYGGHHW